MVLTVVIIYYSLQGEPLFYKARVFPPTVVSRIVVPPWFWTTLAGRVPHTSGSPALADLQSLWLCSCLSPVSLSGENAQALGGIRETRWGGGHRQPRERADQGGPHPEAISQEWHNPGPPPLPGEPPTGHTHPCPALPSPAAEPRP